jgi:hypothetical protein
MQVINHQLIMYKVKIIFKQSEIFKLHLCKVSQNSNKPFRRSCTYKVHNPPFRESISWIISSSKFQTATVFLHAHLQVVYYKCAKFHKNPISGLGGVALTRYMEGRTDRRTDMVIPIYPPQTLFAGGIITEYHLKLVSSVCIFLSFL